MSPYSRGLQWKREKSLCILGYFLLMIIAIPVTWCFNVLVPEILILMVAHAWTFYEVTRSRISSKYREGGGYRGMTRMKIKLDPLVYLERTSSFRSLKSATSWVHLQKTERKCILTFSSVSAPLLLFLFPAGDNNMLQNITPVEQNFNLCNKT